MKTINNAITLLSEMEKQCLALDELLNYNVLFLSYIESRDKAVLWEIIRSSRRNVYHTSDSQVSPGVYTNQSEAVNLMLSAKKYLFPIPRKKILQNLILSSMYGKVQLIVNPLRLNES